MTGFTYMQHICFPKKVKHQFVARGDGDDIFWEHKFLQYNNGSIFLHVEFLADMKDGYTREECMLSPSMMKSPEAEEASFKGSS
eukprot:1824137-Ditylum_brightwellii.AAC.1